MRLFSFFFALCFLYHYVDPFPECIMYVVVGFLFTFLAVKILRIQSYFCNRTEGPSGSGDLIVARPAPPIPNRESYRTRLIMNFINSYYQTIDAMDSLEPTIFFGDPLKCRVCDKKFGTMKRRLPRQLSCGHSICVDCAAAIVRIPWKCPICGETHRSLSEVRYASLNYPVLDVLAKMKASVWIKIARFFQRAPIRPHPICQSCNHEFTDIYNGGFPWTNVHCGHTTCQRCIHESVNRLGYIECPQCVTSSELELDSVWLEHFQRNYVVEDMINSVTEVFYG